jgi:tRNA dimethylallyltransferase
MLNMATPAAAPPLLLAGPTAVGKSEVALVLAGLLDGEIVSVDSMQVYRGLDIGTAKPSALERLQVPHHLIDVVTLAEPFDAAKFVALAQGAVADIQARGRTPILCGGTGLYFKAFLEGLGPAPSADAVLRAELEATPLEQLLRELHERDPAAYARIDRLNLRRVVRAVEVVRLTGQPQAAQRFEWPSATQPRQPVAGFFGLERGADDLRHRINARVDALFARGLVEETRQLLSQGLAENRTALQAIGYRQVVEHLRGERGLADTIAVVKTRTWRYAKRQLTWFRRQAPLTWLAVAPDETAETTAARILEQQAAGEPA